jgi:hypothetical protein
MLNSHWTQLSQIAVRMSALNDALERDAIMLNWLREDAERAHDESRQRLAALDLEFPMRPTLPVAVQALQDRISAQRVLKKEFERGVVWHREEAWAVEKALGRKKDSWARKPDGTFGFKSLPRGTSWEPKR